MFAHMPAYMSKHMSIHIFTYMPAHMPTNMSTHMSKLKKQVYMHACTHVYMHTLGAQVSEIDVQTAVRRVFAGSLAEHAVSEGTQVDMCLAIP